jgi:hypothetical protein
LLAANLASLPALLTPFRWIGEAFLVEELLFATRPGEFLLTVNAGARLVFKLTHFFPFLLASLSFDFGLSG